MLASAALDKALELCQSLLTVLEKESDALMRDDIAILSELSEQKSTLAMTLQSLDSDINRLSKAEQVQPEKWRTLVDQLALCKKRNSTNAMVINGLSHHTREMLHILSTDMDETQTYNQAGTTAQGTSGRTLTSV